MEFLRETLKRYRYIPSFALWRAAELELFSREHFEKPILDVGCGNGSFTNLLFQTGMIDVGIDDDPAVVAEAAKTGTYEKVEVMDVVNMSFPDDQFNSLICNCVLEHVPDLAGALKECHRVLNRDGVFVLTVPSEEFHAYLYHYKRCMSQKEIEKANEYIRTVDFKHKHLHYLSPDEWKNLLASVGFSQIETEYYLSEKTMAIWDRLEAYFTSELFGVIGRLRDRLFITLLITTPYFILWRIWYHLLKRYNKEVVSGALKGGAIFIKCKKG